jgi:hypothetical protein
VEELRSVVRDMLVIGKDFNCFFCSKSLPRAANDVEGNAKDLTDHGWMVVHEAGKLVLACDECSPRHQTVL